jgi:hypothetical protein
MANSLSGGLNFDVAMGTMLINFLGALCVEDLRYGVIRELSDLFERNLENNLFDGAINNVRDMLEEVNEQGIENIPAFRDQAIMLAQRLDAIPNAFLTRAISDLKNSLIVSLTELGTSLHARSQGVMLPEAQQAALSCPMRRLALARVLSQYKTQKRDDAPVPVTVACPVPAMQTPASQTPSAAVLSDAELTKIYSRTSSPAGREGIKKDSGLMARIQASAAAGKQTAKNILSKFGSAPAVAPAVKTPAQEKPSAPVEQAPPQERSSTPPTKTPVPSAAVLSDAELTKIYSRTSSPAGREGIKKDSGLMARIQFSAAAGKQTAKNILSKLAIK